MAACGSPEQHGAVLVAVCAVYLQANGRRQCALYFIIGVKICDQLAGATFKLIINLVQDKVSI